MVLEGMFIGDELFGGAFTKDSTGKINGFESNLEKNKKRKLSFDEKFDTNLHNIINSGKNAVLHHILPLSTNATFNTQLQKIKDLPKPIQELDSPTYRNEHAMDEEEEEIPHGERS